MTHYQKSCPHCGSVYAYTKTTEGIPFMTCSKCGQSFLDKDCYEPALKPFQPIKKVTVGVVAFYIGLAFGFFVFGICWILFEKPMSTSFSIGGIATLAFTIALFVGMHKNYDKGSQEDLEAWKASEERLKNPEYAKALAEAGFKVPEQYLPHKEE